MTADAREPKAGRHRTPDQHAGFEALAPFGGSAGDFELDDLESATRMLRQLPAEPCVNAAIRTALADPPGLHSLSRVTHGELAEWAAIDLLGGDLVALVAPPTSSASGRAKASPPKDEAAAVVVEEVQTAAPAATWIAFRMTDGEGNPAEGLAYRIEFPDGSTRDGKLDSSGLARLESAQAGTCTISFPDVDASEWEGAGATRSGIAARPPATSEDTRTTMARVAVLETDDQPIADTPYELRFGDELRTGRTDDHGVVEEAVPATLESATLTLTDLEIEIELQLGKLDPIEKATGAQSRLNNLGFWCGAVDGKVGPKTRAALAAFQASRGLEPTGELDDATRQQLGAAHEGGS